MISKTVRLVMLSYSWIIRFLKPMMQGNVVRLAPRRPFWMDVPSAEAPACAGMTIGLRFADDFELAFNCGALDSGFRRNDDAPAAGRAG